MRSGHDVLMAVAVDVADGNAAVVEREVGPGLAVFDELQRPGGEAPLSVADPDVQPGIAQPRRRGHDVGNPVPVHVGDDEGSAPEAPGRQSALGDRLEADPARFPGGRQVLEVGEGRAGGRRGRSRRGRGGRGRGCQGAQGLREGLGPLVSLVREDVVVLFILFEVLDRQRAERRAEMPVIEPDVVALEIALDDVLLVLLDDVRVRPGQHLGSGRWRSLRGGRGWHGLRGGLGRRAAQRPRRENDQDRSEYPPGCHLHKTSSK